MKELILIRHAKSSWEYDVIDMHRPIKKGRGVNDIKLISRAFKATKFRPDHIYCSPAKRAQETADLFLISALDGQMEKETVQELYDFSGRQVIDFVKSIPKRYDKVIIFGHNHAFTAISNIFGDKTIDNVPTSGLVHLKFDISTWADLKKGVTLHTIFPRDFK